METFGLGIIQTLLTDIEPAAKVKAAMNEINAATRLRSAAGQKAEAHKISVVKAAEADAEAKFLAGQGIARQRQVLELKFELISCRCFHCECFSRANSFSGTGISLLCVFVCLLRQLRY